MVAFSIEIVPFFSAEATVYLRFAAQFSKPKVYGAKLISLY